jgi:UDP-3-O-[3-hydroxymyristoyl] glucosamine N-acyltransferase
LAIQSASAVAIAGVGPGVQVGSGGWVGSGVSVGTGVYVGKGVTVGTTSVSESKKVWPGTSK